ncbi:MAG: glycosyl transferase family 2, partial [Paracoccaceae bacterium]
VMWDGIDCHKARQCGWIACSWGTPDLRFEHLRAMGSSEGSILKGRRRHGFGQYYMGSDPLFLTATALFRMAYPPYILGGINYLVGYFGAALRGVKRHGDIELRRFICAYQRRALIVGKTRAIEEINARQIKVWAKRGR